MSRVWLDSDYQSDNPNKISFAEKALAGGLAIIGVGIIALGLSANEATEIDDDIVNCAINLVEVDPNIIEAIGAITVCDRFDRLDEDKVLVYANIVLDKVETNK